METLTIILRVIIVHICVMLGRVSLYFFVNDNYEIMIIMKLMVREVIMVINDDGNNGDNDVNDGCHNGNTDNHYNTDHNGNHDNHHHNGNIGDYDRSDYTDNDGKGEII